MRVCVRVCVGECRRALTAGDCEGVYDVLSPLASFAAAGWGPVPRVTRVFALDSVPSTWHSLIRDRLKTPPKLRYARVLFADIYGQRLVVRGFETVSIPVKAAFFFNIKN